MKVTIHRWIHATPALLLFVWLMVFNSCERRPLEYDEKPRAVKIDVKIDWSKSGIDPYSPDGKGVHRVSIRFYPKDNQPIFELYLEENVTEGSIYVPAGRYSVIIYNESVSDSKSFWDGAITFTDVNSFENFAANAVPYADTQRTKEFPFYKPSAGEQFMVEPLRLASWSVNNFEVTEDMITAMNGQKPFANLTEEEKEMFNTFKNVVMRALTRPVDVTAQVENLIATQTAYMAMQGLATKVYMATARTTQSPATHLFIFNRRKYDADKKSGTMNSTFLSFGRTTPSGSNRESYTIAADILFVTGVLYKPDQPFLFDVTGQVLSNYDTKISIELLINFKLPYVEGGIAVDEWEDDVYSLD
jgi:hypothetical protein